jgi:hypothetical protein
MAHAFGQVLLRSRITKHKTVIAYRKRKQLVAAHVRIRLVRERREKQEIEDTGPADKNWKI